MPANTILRPAPASIIGGLSQQTNIEFKKIALQLEVVPLINSEQRSLARYPAEARQPRRQPPGSMATTFPTIATRYIKTTVSAPNGSTIVLGGLIQDDNDRARSGFPILDRLPSIGALFSDTNKIKESQRSSSS